jgi:outer membrane protein assembly factor BamA
MLLRIIFTLCGLFFVAGLGSVSAQIAQTESATVQNLNACEQDKDERNRLIKKAESNQYNIRRIEISGNTSIRHREFVKRMADYFNEGDIFTTKALEKTVKNFAKMKTIYPINMDNVEIRLSEELKDIDFVFCVKQRPKR